MSKDGEVGLYMDPWDDSYEQRGDGKWYRKDTVRVTEAIIPPVENPKHIQAQKDGKVPYDKIPWDVLAGDARVHASGAAKYGERNWRVDKILASTYEGAIMRHFIAWFGGEDNDPDSGESHLYHIRCCCAVMLDAQIHGTLIDDRGR